MTTVRTHFHLFRSLIIVTLFVVGMGSANAWHGGLPQGATGPDLTEIRDLLRSGDWKRAIEAIDNLLPFLEGDSVNIALFLAGKAKIINDDVSGLSYLEQMRTKDDVISHRRLYWLARGYVLKADLAKAKDVYESYRKKTGSTIENVRLQLDVADLIAQKSSHQDALLFVQSLNVRKLGWNEQARLLKIKALGHPDASEQERLLQGLEISHPKLKQELTNLSLSERFRRADRLVKQWHYEEALKEYEYLSAERYRRSTCAWKMAVILQSKLRREPKRVRDLLKTFVESPEHKYHEEALYRTIRALIKDDLYKEALRFIDVYETAYPNGIFREKTAYYRGWLPYDSGQCRRGLPALRAYVRNHSERRRHVRGFIAWCHIRHARWKSAIRAYAPLLRETDSMHGGKALYWQAFAHRKLGDTQSAKDRIKDLEQQYPFTYYAFLGKQLEARIEGRSPQASKLSWPQADRFFKPAGEEAWTWPKTSGRVARTLKQVKRLSDLGELQVARRTYLPVRDRIEKTLTKNQRALFIGFLGSAIEDFNRGYKATGIKRGSGKGMSPSLGDSRWHTAFPLAYRSLVERLATESAIHPYFVYAIMRAESAYMASAVSHAEAVGALQMIRPTALQIAEEIGTEYDPRTFQDPRVGFQYSIHYMRKHLDLWKGNFILAAASYNAGPRPVAQWLKDNRDKPLAFVVEEFVYNEARTYARRVSEYLLRYLALYPVKSTVRAELLDALFPASFSFTIPEDVGY